MSWNLEGSYFETCPCAGAELTVAHAMRSQIDAFGMQYEGNSAFSSSRFAWAA